MDYKSMGNSRKLVCARYFMGSTVRHCAISINEMILWVCMTPYLINHGKSKFWYRQRRFIRVKKSKLYKATVNAFLK